MQSCLLNAFLCFASLHAATQAMLTTGVLSQTGAMLQYSKGAHRSMEDIKARYYAVARQLLVGREGTEDSVANNVLVKHPFNLTHERCSHFSMPYILKGCNGAYTRSYLQWCPQQITPQLTVQFLTQNVPSMVRTPSYTLNSAQQHFILWT